jgi:hypothetical protein
VYTRLIAGFVQWRFVKNGDLGHSGLKSNIMSWQFVAAPMSLVSVRMWVAKTFQSVDRLRHGAVESNSQ